MQANFAFASPNKLSFLESLESFCEFGTKTLVDKSDFAPYYSNEYWTAKQRQAHSLHEISYRACFKAELPRFFIERLTKPNDVVYDPFMGRGTTLLEAALLCRKTIGNDINPLAKMLCEPRLNAPSLIAIKERLLAIPLRAETNEFQELLAFYHEKTLAEIISLREWFLNRIENGTFDYIDDFIRMVALNRLTGHSAGFFSVYTMPPNQAVSLVSQARINIKREQTPPYRSVKEIIIKKAKSLLKDKPPRFNDQLITIGDARKNSAIKDISVDLIVTSPPFLDVINYKQDNWLRGWFANIDIETLKIEQLKKTDAWENFIRECFIDFARVLKPNGHIAFEVGEVKGGKIQLENNVFKAIQGLPFEMLGVMINAQDFTKTANCWGVSNNLKGTNSNRILVLRRI
jgi:DNA modification methylase